MGYLDEVRATLDLRTPLARGQALEVARATIEGLGRIGTLRVRVVPRDGDSFVVVIKALGSLVDEAEFVVWAEAVGEATRVQTEMTKHRTAQVKLLFIPLGPKTAPGAKAYRRCREALQAAFAAHAS